MEKLTLCSIDINTWMTNARLNLNPPKTESFLICSKQQRKHFPSLFPTSLLYHDTPSAFSARNIAAWGRGGGGTGGGGGTSILGSTGDVPLDRVPF